ncbi:exo-beta-N-acetylmuramidase NamZ family protein [Aquirufa sp. 5-AUSEE-100C1]
MNKGNFTGFLFLNFIGYLVNLNQRAKKMGLLRNYKLILVLFFMISLRAIGQVTPGAYQTQKYLPLLKGKQVALVVNHTSVIGKTHLADSLLALGIQVKRIFAPEHGFRGTADAGAHIDNEVDAKTGLPLVSLYGKHKKPSPEDLAGIDVVIFDIQDVGARFYTYSSTLLYVQEACAENKVKLLVFDRPNPNGHYVDGPVLDPVKFASFVGLTAIPVVHGLTMGEYAQMLNGEGWLANKLVCELQVIPVSNYNHKTMYSVPIAPSPNLPNDQSIGLYPSLCLLEPTIVSVGRGTHTQFQVVGTPNADAGNYTFTPVPTPGAMDPPLKGQLCYGLDLRQVNTRQLGFSLSYLIEMFEKTGRKETFFTSPAFFDKLAGTDSIRLGLLAGKSEQEIRTSWKPALDRYKEMRRRYLIYQD